MLVATGERFDTLQVPSLAESSPAMEAGLAPGDRITAWPDIGEPLTFDAARRRLAQPDQRLDLVVERAGTRRTVSLRTRERI
jgi:C-terminal processing protease CtpA/Prc